MNAVFVFGVSFIIWRVLGVSFSQILLSGDICLVPERCHRTCVCRAVDPVLKLRHHALEEVPEALLAPARGDLVPPRAPIRGAIAGFSFLGLVCSREFTNGIRSRIATQ